MKSSITQMHFLCEDWKRDLLFFRDEIPLLKKRLEELVFRNTNKDILMNIEHFENKFSILKQHVEELLHDVRLKSRQLNSEAENKSNYIHVKMISNDDNIGDLINITANDFYETKKEFYRFLSGVM